MEIKKNGKKMKIVGYACIVFAFLIAISDLFGWSDSENSIIIMQFWAATGISMLFGNAAKRIVGGAQINKANGSAK